MIRERLADELAVGAAVRRLIGEHHRSPDGAEPPWPEHRRFCAAVEQPPGVTGGPPERGLVVGAVVHQQCAEQGPEASAHDSSEAVGFGGEHRGAPGAWQRLRQLPPVRVERPSGFGRGVVDAEHESVPVRELLADRLDRVRRSEIGGRSEQSDAVPPIVERGDDCRDVAERLVEGGDLGEVRQPQVGSSDVEHGVADLVRDEVGARTGIDVGAVRRPVPEEEPISLVERVQVFA